MPTEPSFYVLVLAMPLIVGFLIQVLLRRSRYGFVVTILAAAATASLWIAGAAGGGSAMLGVRGIQLFFIFVGSLIGTLVFFFVRRRQNRSRMKGKR